MKAHVTNDDDCQLLKSASRSIDTFAFLNKKKVLSVEKHTHIFFCVSDMMASQPKKNIKLFSVFYVSHR